MTTSTRITWTCKHCRKPIKDGTGWITIAQSAVWQWQRDEKAWRESREDPHWLTGKDLDARPDEPRWNVVHSKCDAEDTGTDYTINIERIRTERDLLSWSAHLLGKTWIQHTDWHRVIRKAIRHHYA